jgi:hypothetical protein
MSLRVSTENKIDANRATPRPLAGDGVDAHLLELLPDELLLSYKHETSSIFV